MFRNLVWLAIGMFAIGTQSFMLAGILPVMARDLGVSQAEAGQLMTVFALTYAAGAPVMAVLGANLPGNALLLSAMAVFGLASLAAVAAPDYGWLMATRVVLGLAAATFAPAATGAAAVLVPAERRGRAIALIYGGMTLAIVAGVPLGTVAADHFGWRSSFLGVGIMSAVTFVGSLVALPRLPTGPSVSLRARLAVAVRADVLILLGQTTLAMTGVFTVMTYLGALLSTVYGASSGTTAGVLALSGVAGAIGNSVGGIAADRFDRTRSMGLVFGLLAVIFTGLGLVASYDAGPGGFWLFTVLVVVMGLVGWAFPSLQQARLVAVAPALASVTLSLNATAIYLGTALGAMSGAATIRAASVAAIGFSGAAAHLAAFVLLAATLGVARRRTCPAAG